MRNRLFLNLVFASVLWSVSGCLIDGDQPDVPTPQPSPDNIVPDDLFGFDRTIPGTIPDRNDALQLAALADEYAKQIEFDGKQDEPQVTTSKQAADRMEMMSKYAFRGRALASKAFADAVAEAVSSELETEEEGRELDSDLRKKTVSMFQALAWSLRL